MRQFFPKEIKVHFNLRQPNSQHPTAIFLVIYVKGKQYKFPIGVKVYPSHWSKKYEQAVVSWKLNKNENTNNTIVNAKINSIISQLSELFPYLCCADDVIPTIKSILPTMGRRPKKEIDIIKVLLNGIDSDNTLEYGTKVNKRNFVSHLQAFLESDEAKSLKIKNFKDLAKTEVFEIYRDSIKRRPRTEGGSVGKEANLRVGFANKIVKNTKTLLKQYAVKNEIGFLTMTDITNIVLRLPQDLSDDDNKIFLRDDEILKIYNHKCNDPKDEIVKDLFVLECTVGFRVSEIIALKKHILYDENGKIYISFKPEKTKKSKAKVDCVVYFELARKILMKYKDIDFPDIDIKGDYGRRLKRICKKCGMTELCEQVKHFDGEEKVRAPWVEKYKLISSHTGRHTFIVMMRLRGFKCEEIQLFTGHKTYEMILDYSSRMRQIDYDNFDQLKTEHPEQVLQPCGKADNGGLAPAISPALQTQMASIPPNNNDFIRLYDEKKHQEKVKELKDILVYLGADYIDIADIDDKDYLSCLLYGQFERKLLEEGVKRELIKSIYNTLDLPLKNRQEKLFAVVEAVRNDLKNK